MDPNMAVISTGTTELLFTPQPNQKYIIAVTCDPSPGYEYRYSAFEGKYQLLVDWSGVLIYIYPVL
jgi:hypothetical protein